MRRILNFPWRARRGNEPPEDPRVKDSECSTCYECGREFSLIVRRDCLMVHCDDCASKHLPAAAVGHLTNVTSSQGCCNKCSELYVNSLPNDDGSRAREENTQLDGARGETVEDAVTGNSLLPPNASAPCRPARLPSKRHSEDPQHATSADFPTPLPSGASLGVQTESQPSSLSADTDSSEQGTLASQQSSLAFADSPSQRAAASIHHKASHSAIPTTLTPAREPSKASPSLPSPLVRMHTAESTETESVKDSNATPRAPGAGLVSTLRSIIQHASPRVGNQNTPTQRGLSAAHSRASAFSEWTSGPLPEDLDLGAPTSTQRSLASHAAHARSPREQSSLCWEEPVQLPTDYGDPFISEPPHQPQRPVPPTAGCHNGSAGCLGPHMLNRLTTWSHASAGGGDLPSDSSGALLGETTPRAGGMARDTRRTAGAALMGEMPRELEQSLPPVTADLRKGLSEVPRSHLSAIINQRLVAEEVEEREAWLPVLHNLAMQSAQYLTPTQICKQQEGSMLDPRHYLKVKRIADGRSVPARSVAIQGVAFTKSLVDRSMSTSIEAPRVLLLRRAAEPEASQLMAMESLTKEAPEQGSASDPRAEKLRALKPDLVLVQQTVPRTTKDLLKAHHISLAMKVEGEKGGRKDIGLPHLDRLAMCSGKTVADGIDDISEENVMTCANFTVEEVGVASAADTSPADAPGGGRTARKSLMTFQGTCYGLGCTVILRGRSLSELVRVKRVLRFAVFAAYRGRLETAFLADACTSLVATLNPSLHRTQHSVPASSTWAPPELHGEKVPDWASWAATVGTSCVNTGRPVMSTSPYVQQWRFPEESDARGELGLARQDSVSKEKLQAALDSKANQENSSICSQNRTEVTYMVINPDNMLPCVPAKPQSFGHYGKDDLRIVDVLSIFRPFKRCGECNDSMSKHLAVYLHGNKRVCIRSHPVPPGLGDSTGENGCTDGGAHTSGAPGCGAEEVWLWVRVKNRQRTERGHCRKVRLSADAQCMSFGHLLEIMCSKSSLMVDNTGLASDVVMYFKVGNFMVALSSDFTHVFGIQMPQDPIFFNVRTLKDMIRREAGSLRQQVDKSFSEISPLVEGLRLMAAQPLQHVEGKRRLANGSTLDDLTQAMKAKLEELRNLEDLLTRRHGDILHGLDDVVQGLSTDMMVEDHKALDVWLTWQRVPATSAAFRRHKSLRIRVLELRTLVSKFMVEWGEQVAAIQKGLTSAIEAHTQPVPQHQKTAFSFLWFQSSNANVNPSPTPAMEPFPCPLDPPALTPAPQREEVVVVTLVADILGYVTVHVWSEALQREPADGTKSALQPPCTPTTRSFATAFRDEHCEDEKSTQSGDVSSHVAAGRPEAPLAIGRPPQLEHPPVACLSITALQLNSESAFNDDETPRAPPSCRAVLLKHAMSDTTATTGGAGRPEDMERSSSGGAVIERRKDTGSPGSECDLAPGMQESSAQLAFKDVVSGSQKPVLSPGQPGKATGRASSACHAHENQAGGVSIPVHADCPASAIAHFLSSQKYLDAVTAKHKQFRAAWQAGATGTASEVASTQAPRGAAQDSAHVDALSTKALTTGGGPASELGDDGEGAGGGGGTGNVSQRELPGHAVVPPHWPMGREDSLRSMLGPQLLAKLLAKLGLPGIDIDALDVATGGSDAGVARDPATEEELSLAILEAATKHDANEISVEFSEAPSGHQHFPVRCKVTSYFPLQFRELRRRVIEGGDLAFALSLSRSDEMRAHGGKSKAGFFLTLDRRFILKAVIDREKSSTTTTAAQHFQHYARCHREGGSTCFAKTLGVFFVEMKSADKEFREWLIVTENIYYDLPESSLVRRFDVKGKAPTLKRQPPALHTGTTDPDPDQAVPEESEQGDGAAARTGGGRPVKVVVNNSEGGSAGKVGKKDMDGDTMFLDDYGVKPLIVPKLEHDRLMKALERDVNFLASMKITDYSMLLAVDGVNGVIRVGIIDYVRLYRIGEGLEQLTKEWLYWGQMPTVIRPQQYADRLREAITKYFTCVPFDDGHSRPDLTCGQICWPPAQRSCRV